VSNPITVRQYQHFIEDRLNTVNELIAEGKVREAFDLVEQIRDWVPRNPPSVPKRSFTPENVETLLNDAFNNIGLRWSITNIGFNGKRRYILNDPVEYGSPVSKHRILPNQSITSIPYNAAEAYTQWRAAQDGRPYRIISAREKEIISRNGFPWTYPWGYHFRRTALASRLVHRDLKNDAYSHPQGTHPLGPNYFRDFVAYGRYQEDGSLTRLVDLIGNDREWTSTVGEERTRVMSGGSVRSPSGNLFLPASTTYATERDWVAECNGAFRLVLPLPPSRRGR
ncbi:MAG: SUMF1/EgtB/PvdO family nonheme iron enzyme, partial [Deltaproteobacteria bacterium]|nr:SUMF1/EgtB/PvdO family nonheme iron enzyme [Deltaproteobacteria bacterium]